ncbi:MAG TPA: DUF1217 domain-containing protein [Paracoccaceae bacterium]|nr:DUF1217 domain-containing protein [Paracoccaceae bacterium]
MERATEHYLEKIVDVHSIEDFLADERVFSYAMTAFGLGEMTYAKAFVRKILEEGVDDSASLANRLADGRYREFAEAFNFARYGETTTSFGRTQEGTVDRYVRQALEVDAGRQNEGVRLALYFERKTAEIDSPMDILADPALLRVVQTATGLSPLTSAADIDRQAEMITARLDVADLKDPSKLESFLARFTALWELGRTDTAAVPAVMAGQARPFGLSADLLASLQGLRLGGI